MALAPKASAWLGLAALLVASPSSYAESPPEVLPRGVLFDPLLADPRWAHFSAAWHDYGGNQGLDNLGSVSLGEDFSFYQAAAGNGRWGFGLQAGVFAIFDLDASSSDLVNADYQVGIPVSWRDGPWQARARLYHQSSHLGDEYLLRVRPDRVNLSYEAVDLKLSRHFDDLRLYGGVGVMVHSTPDLDPLSLQLGAEYRLPWSFANGYLRPIVAVDVQMAEEAGWEASVSTRMGVELGADRDRDYRVLLTLEYFNGRNPNGQFYRTDVDWWGIGVHTFF